MDILFVTGQTGSALSGAHAETKLTGS